MINTNKSWIQNQKVNPGKGTILVKIDKEYVKVIDKDQVKLIDRNPLTTIDSNTK